MTTATEKNTIKRINRILVSLSHTAGLKVKAIRNPYIKKNYGQFILSNENKNQLLNGHDDLNVLVAWTAHEHFPYRYDLWSPYIPDIKREANKLRATKPNDLERNLPLGWLIEPVNGDDLDCRRSNLRLVKQPYHDAIRRIAAQEAA